MRPEQTLCKIRQNRLVSGTFPVPFPSTFNKHFHLHFRLPNACSIATLLLFMDLLNLTWSHVASVPHQRLLLKLAFYAIHCHTLTWIEHFCNKSHTVYSTWQAPIYLPVSTTSPTISLRKFAFFADDCTIYLELSSATSPQQLQTDLNSLSLRAYKWQMHSIVANVIVCILPIAHL